MLTNKNFGQAVLFRNEILILQSSMSIDFWYFKEGKENKVHDHS